MNHTKLSKSEKKDAFAQKYSIYGSITYWLFIHDSFLTLMYESGIIFCCVICTCICNIVCMHKYLIHRWFMQSSSCTPDISIQQFCIDEEDEKHKYGIAHIFINQGCNSYAWCRGGNTCHKVQYISAGEGFGTCNIPVRCFKYKCVVCSKIDAWFACALRWCDCTNNTKIRRSISSHRRGRVTRSWYVIMCYVQSTSLANI